MYVELYMHIRNTFILRFISFDLITTTLLTWQVLTNQHTSSSKLVIFVDWYDVLRQRIVGDIGGAHTCRDKRGAWLQSPVSGLD
jgi:hypothetical protein